MKYMQDTASGSCVVKHEVHKFIQVNNTVLQLILCGLDS